VAPLAVNVVEAPEQILVFGDTLTVNGATVTVTVPLLVQPAVVPVTV
jgi:hypothetical protein